jgi:hypothetical protein
VGADATFAHAQVAALFAAVSPKPQLAITAWAQHGSGMYDVNANVEGAANVAAILIAMQGLPIEFSIYYKFTGINCYNTGAPCLVVMDSGALKPAGLAFRLVSSVTATGTARVTASCTGGAEGSSVLAVTGAAAFDAAAHTGQLAAVLAGPADTDRPANLRVTPVAGDGAWPCVGMLSTLTVTALAAPDAAAGGAGTVADTVTVQGAVRSDGLFHKQGNDDPYYLPQALAGQDGAYVAAITLSCGTGGDGDGLSGLPSVDAAGTTHMAVVTTPAPEGVQGNGANGGRTAPAVLTLVLSLASALLAFR